MCSSGDPSTYHKLVTNNTSVIVIFRTIFCFHQIRDMSHPNLLRVVGAHLEGDKRTLVTEHCPKGSLQVKSMHDLSGYTENIQRRN